MPKLAKELPAVAIARIERAGLHFVGTVPGLALHIGPAGARSWIFRASIGGKRREMGLGNFPSVTLAMAREKARVARELIRQGVDPVERQQRAQYELRAAVASAMTVKQCANAYLAAHEASWRNAKHAQQWRNTLAQYVYPVIGELNVREVTLPHVLTILEPIWRDRTETASRLRGRLEVVLDWATARGYREGTNPARWRGHLDKLLPARAKVAKAEHHAAIPVHEVGAFMGDLREAEGRGARALQFLILTAARSGEVRGAKWSEIDKHAKVWTIPAARMKAGKEHRVPLSDATIELLDSLEREVTNELVFPAPRGGMLSDMTLMAVLRRMQVPCTVHGFRSTFRDWAAERTNYPHEVAEMALAHAIGNKVEAAYRRGDLFEKRRRMMDDWAKFCSKVERKGQVIPMQTAAGRLSVTHP